MENYISINGIPVIGNHRILEVLLREDLAYDGMAVSDFGEIGSMNNFHRVARDANEAVRFSYTHTGIDISMGYDTTYLNIMIPYNHRVSTECADSSYCEMQWEFGTGLSYTNFTYADLTLSMTNVTSGSDSIDVSVVVTNSGSMAGKETVMVFLIQPYRSISVPKVKQLKKFSKISLEAGESQTMSFTLTADDWSVYYLQIGNSFKQVAEGMDYVIVIKPETDCDVYNETAAVNPLCGTFTLQTGDYPYVVLLG